MALPNEIYVIEDSADEVTAYRTVTELVEESDAQDGDLVAVYQLVATKRLKSAPVLVDEPSV